MKRLPPIPDQFYRVRYNAAVYPGTVDYNDLSNGANCQVFAYALLKHFGIDIPAFRSSDLWEDKLHTVVATEYEPLDLLLFGRTIDPYGAHVAMYTGEGQAIHLSKEIGVPDEWPLTKFALRPEYRVLIGAKRVISVAHKF